MGDLANADPSLDDLRVLLREAGVLAFGVLIGMLVSQIDRIVLSRSVDIASFGRYVIVANLGLAFMQLQYPLIRAFFPRIVKGVVSGGGSSMWQLGTGIFLFSVLPCLLIAMAAPWLLHIWLHDPVIVLQGSLPLRLILGEVALTSIYQLFYQQIIARGQGQAVVLINLSTLLVVLPVIIILVETHGIVAGAAARTIGAAVQLSLGFLWLRYSCERFVSKKAKP